MEIQAFSAGKFSSRCVIRQQRTLTCATAIFQDEDCEDLCGAFGEDFTAAASLDQVEDDTATKSQVKVNSYAPPRLSRHTPRALWWTEEGLDKCKTCHGSGEQTCRFCGGTDFLSAIGGETDALFTEGIGKDCPVCNDGIESCNKCAGTGSIFTWSPPEPDRDRTNSLHP